MRIFPGLLIGSLAIGLTVSGPGALISIITDILDLTLQITNVVTEGAVYYPSIKTYQNEIDAMEKELTPKLRTLDQLDMSNGQLYQDVTDNLAYNDDLARQSGNVQYLVVSITKKLGTGVVRYDDLAKEFEYQTNQLITTYKADVEQIKNVAVTRLTITAGVDAAKLLYYGLKHVYKRFKADGKISKPNDFKGQLVQAGATDLTVTPKPNPRFRAAKEALTGVRTWWNKPNVKKIRGYVSEAGIVVGSLFSLGVGLGVDIIMAKKMRDTLYETRNQLRDIKNSIDGYIANEREIKKNLNSAFNDAKNSFGEFTSLLEQSVTLQGVKSSRIKFITTATELKRQQKIVIDAFVDAQNSLIDVHMNVEILTVIKDGVYFNDPVQRIISSIQRRGLGTFTTQDILKAIAKDNPTMSSYDGNNLSGYRG